MKTALADSILARYLESYRGLIEIEPIEDNSVTISFPFHYSADHRIEVTVTEIAKDRFVLSDMARTLGELRDAGYSIGSETRKRIETIAKKSNLALVGNHFILECERKGLGDAIQEFLEAAKTIADVYLVHGRPRISPESAITEQVRKILHARKLLYREKDKIAGEIERHAVDFYVAPNGTPGLAVAILYGYNSHIVAEAWGFKAEDIKRANPKTKVGLIYDVETGKWTDESKRILTERADIAVPGDSLAAFDEQLPKLGVVRA